MMNHFKLLRCLRRGVPAVVAGLALAPVAVWDSSPAAQAGQTPTTIESQANSSTKLFVVALAGSSLTLRAKVTGAPDSAEIPTGSVTFAIDGSSGAVQCDGLSNTMRMSGGVATCKVTSKLTASGLPETALATYSGDDNFTTSESTLYASDGNFNSSVPTTSTTSTPTTPTTTTPTTSGQQNTQPSGTAGFGQPVMAAPSGYSAAPILDDKFSGTSLDTTHWSDVMGGPVPDVGAWGGYGAAPVVNNGLTLTNIGGASMVDTANPRTGKNLFQFPAGGFYLQVNFKVSDMSAGFFPAIWFPYDNNIHLNAHEIDLFEGGFLPSSYGLSGHPDNNIVESNYGGGSSQISGPFIQYVVDAGEDITQNFVTMGVEFVPGSHVNFYLGQGATRTLTGSYTNAAIIGAFANYNLVITPQATPGGSSGWHTQGPGTGSMYIAEVQVYRLP